MFDGGNRVAEHTVRAVVNKEVLVDKSKDVLGWLLVACEDPQEHYRRTQIRNRPKPVIALSIASASGS